jgi:hypothetical protein
MAQLTLSPWQKLYDSASNDIVQTTTNAILNGKLYAKLLISLEGQALQSIVSRMPLKLLQPKLVNFGLSLNVHLLK